MRYLLIILAVVILCSGCAGHRGITKEQTADATLPIPEAEPEPYILGVDDVVKIDVQMHPELTGEFAVTPEGTLFLPIIGDVTVKGLTKEELADILRERYKEYVEELQLAVGISEYRSKKVYVLGEIRRPGKVYMKGNVLNLLDAIVEAGLPTDDAALNRVYVVTPALEEPIVRKVNMKKVMYRGYAEENLALNPDDIVVVPASFSSSLTSYIDVILTPSRRIRDLDDIYQYFEDRDEYWEQRREYYTGD